MLDFNKDIIFQIEMMSYNEYNDRIANANDHLGEFYCLKDVEDMKVAKKAYEKKCAYEAIKKLQEERFQIKKENLILERYLTLIYDLAYDRDGHCQAEKLASLIDEIFNLAKLGRERNLIEPIYEEKNEKFNILFEKIEDKK